jgi:hypothetical protein
MAPIEAFDTNASTSKSKEKAPRGFYLPALIL